MTRLVIILLFFIPTLVFTQNAQDSSKVKKTKWVGLTGNITLRTGFYQAYGIQQRQDNFQYLVQSNLNFSFFNNQVNAPFSAFVSQQNQGFLQPFNQYGVSPTYKNVTLHLGYRNITYNKYTLGGHNFLGAGVDYKIKKVRVSAMYGRFRKEIADERGQNIFTGGASYRRMGYGTMIGYGTRKNHIDFILFKASDDPSEVDLTTLDSTIRREENFAVGVNLRRQLHEKVTFTAHYGLSAYSADLQSAQSDAQRFRVYNNVPFLFTPRTSSSYKGAGDASIRFKNKNYNLSLDYEYIAPGYRTLGAFFFQDDIENITLGAGWNRNKWSLNVRGGTQRNNLDNAKETTNRRFISSVNGNWRLGKKTSLGANYSNFSAFSTAVQRIGTDSLDFFQVTHNATIFMNHVLDSTSSFSLNASHQNAFARTADDITSNETQFYALTGNYNKRLPALDLVITTSLNYNFIYSAFDETTTLGPSIGLTKLWFKKKLQTQLTNSYQTISSSSNGNGAFYTVFFRSSYNLTAKQAIGLDTRYNTRSSSTINFSEWQGFISYTFNF